MGTWIAWPALLIGVIAFGYAWRLQQELQQATRRLDRYNRALFDANDQIHQLRGELSDLTAQVQVAAEQSGLGTPTFTPKITIGEAVALHPQVEQILAGFHLGGCSSCAVSPDDTLAQVCRDNDRDLAELLRTLNLLSTKPNGNAAVTLQPLKLPNVEVSF